MTDPVTAPVVLALFVRGAGRRLDRMVMAFVFGIFGGQLRSASRSFAAKDASDVHLFVFRCGLMCLVGCGVEQFPRGLLGFGSGPLRRHIPLRFNIRRSLYALLSRGFGRGCRRRLLWLQVPVLGDGLAGQDDGLVSRRWTESFGTLRALGTRFARALGA